MCISDRNQTRLLVRPVEIGSRRQSADMGSDSGYNLTMECFEQNELEESISIGR